MQTLYVSPRREAPHPVIPTPGSQWSRVRRFFGNRTTHSDPSPECVQPARLRAPSKLASAPLLGL